MVMEKPESPYIHCTMTLVQDNTSIQGVIRGARHLPDPDAVVEAHVRIGLTTKSGKPSYSLKGKTFSSVDSLARELLNTILDTVNQQPAVFRLLAAQQAFDAEMKRGVQAVNAEWTRNLRARQKRTLNARAGR